MSWTHAGHYINEMVNSTTGVPLATTNYQVFQSDGVTLASIYTDAIRSAPRTQPLTTDSSGNAEFFTDPQDIVISIGSANLHDSVLPSVGDLAALLTAALTTQNNDFGTNVISDFLIKQQVKTAGYTFLSTDTGGTFTLDSGSSQTWTLPNNLPAGWQISWRQKGAGQILFSAASGATLENANSQAKSRAAAARGGLEVVSNSGTNAVYSLFGDTSA